MTPDGNRLRVMLTQSGVPARFFRMLVPILP